MSEQSLNHWRRANIKINLSALSHNLKKVREFAPASKVMAVIKANAYGHGMLAAAEQLDAADMFAVAMPAEAHALRAAGCTKPVIVLHGFSNHEELELFSELNLSSVVHQQQQLDMLVSHPLSRAIDVWIKADTGMNRLGISCDLVDAFYAQLQNCQNVKDVFLMSHFANAEDVGSEININQLNAFLKVKSSIEVASSMANSAAIMQLPESHFEVVRPGIMLYGSSPLPHQSADELGLRAVMQFESMLIDIKVVKAGQSIGYGGTFTCAEDTTIGVVAAGYGDGYPRHAKTGTPIWLNGQRCDLLGRVSMDSLCINLDGINASIGDRVVLWGEELSVDAVSVASDSISYQLLCNAGAAYFAQ